MSNPFLKKNPLMSMWLSAANRTANTMRGQASAQAKRQINAAVTKATNDNLKAMFGGTVPAAPKAKPKKRR
ncbi:MAG: hypothetical protein CVU34_17655 [Betaproteobacteria bacterium HGW-Betaproteobacteria-7]|jgi:hypothetical protein|nr:MAG: hypothetical protein CVU34_17655 [Betaproteobacteria bacterium HGW-Betaproteobacteria-7]